MKNNKKQQLQSPINEDEDDPWPPSALRVEWRWYALALITTMPLGAYYSFDFPAFLAEPLLSLFNIGQTRFSLLYSIYSMPNMILPLFGGLFLDKVGIHKGLLITSLFVTTGQGIVSFGGAILSFNTLLVGRTIYGIGCETLYVV